MNLRVNDRGRVAHREIGADGKGRAWLEEAAGRGPLVEVSFERSEPPRGAWWSPIAALGVVQAARISPPLRIEAGEDRTEYQRRVVKTYIDEFKNRKRFHVFPKVFSPTFRHHFAYSGADDGMTTWVRTGQDFLRGFPDVQVEVIALLVDGDLVVECNRATAAHRGQFRGYAATERNITWNEIHFYRLSEGKIVENWPAVDYRAIVAQLAFRRTPVLALPGL